MDKTLHFWYTRDMTATFGQPEPAAHALEKAKPIPGLRADAERNRQRIVEAARALFAERGLNVPLEEIAHRAQVGIATLYRRFPTREDLIAASFEAKMAGRGSAAFLSRCVLCRQPTWVCKTC
jgi:AcrR family transcriptional regulator